MLDKVHSQFAVMAIDALGGSTKVAHLFGLDERVVSNWKRRGLPPDTYAAMAPMLQQIGRDAPAVMFKQRMVLRKRVVRPSRPKSLKEARPSSNGNSAPRRRRR